MVKLVDRLASATELMDSACADPTELDRTLRDLAWINRWLGGTQLIRNRIGPLLVRLRGPIRILDVATGYADIPRAIARWARKRGLAVEIEGLDRHPQILELAEQACRAYPEIRIRHGNALALPYSAGSFDIVLASLILHHMEGNDQVQLLMELYRVARHAVLVSDLRRGRWPFLITWASLHVISRSPLILHDGPISIRRGFHAEELLVLAKEAGWAQPRPSRHAFFRLALQGQKG